MSKDEYKDLRDKVAQAQIDYHQHDAPTMTDAEYDIIFNRLKAFEEKYPGWVIPHESVTENVGAPIKRGLYPVRHEEPMLSLDNIFTIAELQDWYPDRDMGGIVTSYKYDGLACSLHYLNHQLVEASTRGDRFEGESILHNVIGYDSIPRGLHHKAPSELIVRGELLMFNDEFERYNERLEALGLARAINPRNAAAGLARRLSKDRLPGAQLVFFPYAVLYPNSNRRPYSHSDSMKQLARYGFEIPPIPPQNFEDLVKKEGPEPLVDFINGCIEQRALLPFGIDGLVFRVDAYDVCDILGSTSRAPRWAIAYKFPPEEKTTVVRNIRIQIGRTGNATPVAEVDPVLVGGVTVSTATLHNEDHINRLGIAIGDEVIIRRAGDVVPEIAQVRPAHGPRTVWQFPTHCECGGDLVRVNGQANHICTNPDCDFKRLRGLEHFVSRNGMDIEGLGEELLEKLYMANTVLTYPDLFALKAQDILDVTSETSTRYAQVIIDAINKSRTTTLRRFLFALGIPNAGEGTAKRLHEYLGSLKAIYGAPLPVLKAIPDIGTIVAESIRNYMEGAWIAIDMQRDGIIKFTDETGPSPELAKLELPQLLKLSGIKGLTTKRLEKIREWAHHYGWWDVLPKEVEPLPEAEHAEAEAFHEQWAEELKQVKDAVQFVKYYSPQVRQIEGNQPLAGNTYVITGNFDETLGTRQKLTTELEHLGAKVSGSVSAKTTAVFVGDSPGANKLDKAKSLGVPTLFVQDLRELLAKHSQ